MTFAKGTFNLCGAAYDFTGQSLSELARSGAGWIANGNMRARLIVGAGGHFCPVAHNLSPGQSEATVVAQETEFEMDARQSAACSVRATVPELYFCPDMKGYGWCFRKGNVLNIGLGRANSHGLPLHVKSFLSFLATTAGLSLDIPALRGHAYLLYGTSRRSIAGDGFLLVGDSAGLAHPQSGEGILPAIESGLLAAETILSAKGNYGAPQLEPYKRGIDERIGGGYSDWAMRIGGCLPPGLIQFVAKQLMNSRWFVRHLVLDRCFLHC